MTTHDPIPARLAALKAATMQELKAQWRDLFDSEPPPFNRRYLESRLAYRIQELAYGGLKPETVRRLERLGEELDGGDRKKSRVRADTMPIAGTLSIGVQSGPQIGAQKGPLCAAGSRPEAAELSGGADGSGRRGAGLRPGS